MEGIPHALDSFTDSGLVVGSTHSLEVYFFNLNFHSKSQFKFYVRFYYD